MRKRTSSSGPQGLGSGWGRSGASGAPGWGWGWACTGSGAPWPPLSRAPIVCKEKPLDAGQLHATRLSRHAPARPSSLTARATGLQCPRAGDCTPLACVLALGGAGVVTSPHAGPAP